MGFMKELEELGVDVQEGMDRVMGDESLYTMMLGMFVSAVEGSTIQVSDFDGSDLAGLTGQIHTLKGTTGNLSITPLFNSYTQTLTLLREGKPAEAKAAYQQLLPVQERVLECIRRNQ